MCKEEYEDIKQMVEKLSVETKICLIKTFLDKQKFPRTVDNSIYVELTRSGSNNCAVTVCHIESSTLMTLYGSRIRCESIRRLDISELDKILNYYLNE